MQAKGAGELKYDWTVPSIVEAKDVLPGKLVLKRAQNSGKLTVTVAVSNGGQPVIRTVEIAVKEPATDPWVAADPGEGRETRGRPVLRPRRQQRRHAVLQRHARPAGRCRVPEGLCRRQAVQDRDAATRGRQVLRLHGQAQAGTDQVPRRVRHQDRRPGEGAAHGRQPGLRRRLPDRRAIQRLGHRYRRGVAARHERVDPQLRRPAGPGRRHRLGPRPLQRGPAAGLARPNLWCSPVWKTNRPEHKAELGWWGMELAKRLVASQKVPDLHRQRGRGRHADRRTPAVAREPRRSEDDLRPHALARRAGPADARHSRRPVAPGRERPGLRTAPTAVTAGRPTSDTSSTCRRPGSRISPTSAITTSSRSGPTRAAWATAHGDMLREVQRTLPRHYSNMDIMPTLGIKPPGPCHYPLTGWAEFARLVQPLIERDFYGKAPAASITAPNLKRACYANRARTRSPWSSTSPSSGRKRWPPVLPGWHHGKVASGTVSGNVLTLKLRQLPRRRRSPILRR